MSALPMNSLSSAVTVLASLMQRFPDLPAAAAQVSPILPDRLTLSIHQGLDGFEVWRSALGISPALVRREVEDGGGPLMWLRAETTVNSVTVELVGYGTTLVDPADEADVAPADSAVTS